MFDYDESPSHPAFNLILRVNFVSGAPENGGFRFIGSDGILTVDSKVTLSAGPRESEPGYSIGTFAEAQQQAFLKKYHQQYPDLRPTVAQVRARHEEVFEAPHGYSDHVDHHLNFANSIRTRKPPVEDATFGFRAAGPALLCNLSYFEKRIVRWDPSTMTAP
jgi:hypothetical protein